jgi:hypothetical protein
VAVALPEDGKRFWRLFEHFEPLRFAFGIRLCRVLIKEPAPGIHH